VRTFLSLVIVVSLAFLVGCGGSGTPAGVPTGGGGGGGAANVQSIAVDGGPVATTIYPNGAFTSVTICNPGTTTCQTIDGILVDTGSFGLRILSSAITLTGLQVFTSGSSTLYNCINFADGSFLWGTVALADVKMASELASSAPIQVIADPSAGTFTIPANCSNGGIDEDTQATLGTNGILGVGPEPVDCGLACDPFGGNQFAPEPFYYSCASGTPCTPVFASCGAICADPNQNQQLTNPVALFANDNNGVIVQLPALSGAAATESGSLIFGIGTQTNNQIPSTATIFTLDSLDTFSVTYKGVTYNSANNTPSFIDLGSNAFFFPDATIPACTDVTAFYCPTSLLSLSATNQGATSGTGTVNFSIDNADNLFAAGGGADAAFSTLGGPNAGGGFDYGLPFFYGKSVFTAIDGAAVPSGAPAAPWWAY
jgi:hypothetical protein